MVYSKYPPYEIMQNKDMSYEELQRIKRIARYLDIFYNSGNFPRAVMLLLQSKNSTFEAMDDFSNYIWQNYQQTHKISIGRQTKILFEYLIQFLAVEDVAIALISDYENKHRKDNIYYIREVLK